MKKSLIYIDPENIENSIELLKAVEEIHKNDDYNTYAVIINHPIKEIENSFDYIIRVDNDTVEQYNQIAVTDILEKLNNEYEFNSIVIPATHWGRMLAPRLAMRLHVGLVADVTKIRHTEAGLELVRPAYSGRIMAGITNDGKEPIMLSVRQNVFVFDDAKNKESKIINYESDNFNNEQIKLLESKNNEESYDIRESEILVSGGGGILKDFNQIEELAELLNAEVSASRKIIDNGKASRSIQVGQSGKTVSPDLYIALGIRGAIEHIAGLKNVENIISVNINKNAPICSLSDLVVKGDAIEFANKLIKKIKNNNN
ncbi:MAG: electron transfer flavoprotein subunit alpha/FixB family protein [Bacillota bacterium]